MCILRPHSTLHLCLFVFVLVRLNDCVGMCVCVCVFLFVCLFNCLFVCLFVYVKHTKRRYSV